MSRVLPVFRLSSIYKSCSFLCNWIEYCTDLHISLNHRSILHSVTTRPQVEFEHNKQTTTDPRAQQSGVLLHGDFSPIPYPI